MHQLKKPKVTNQTAPLCTGEHSNGPITHDHSHCKQFQTVVTKNYTLTVTLKDSCVLTENRQVGIVKNILLHGQDIFLVLKLYSEVQSLYTYYL